MKILRNSRGRNSLSERDKLRKEFESAFNYLKIDDVAEGIKVSVPNNTKSVIVTLNEGLYKVKSCMFESTYNNFEDARMEVLENLVTRELYDNNFNESQVNYVIKLLIKS